jgi:hypothetical protein
MPPLFRPQPRTAKQPPHVLTRDLAALVDLGDGGWPRLLVIPTDAGLMVPFGMLDRPKCDNDDAFGESSSI